MAKVMESLRINMMGDLMLPALAQVLRSKGRGPDTVLAHITPQEAEKLKKEGGSGSINPDTGLPEFFNGSEYYTSYGGYEGPVYPDYSGGSTFDASTISSNYEPSYTYQPDFSARTYEAPIRMNLLSQQEQKPFLNRHVLKKLLDLQDLVLNLLQDKKKLSLKDNL